MDKDTFYKKITHLVGVKMLFYIGIFIGFLVLFSLYGFWVAIHPSKFITNLTPKDMKWNYEEVTLITDDNIKLSSWWVPAQNPSEKVIIMLHGYPADKANLLPWSKFLHEEYNLFFLDFRYFGESEGSMTTVGYKEQQDLKAAIDYLNEKDFTKIGAMGFSLGGAVGILTAGKQEGLKAIVSDSAFANIDLMSHEFYKNLFVLKYPLTFLTKLWAQIFLGINLNEIAPEISAINLTIPILLIHSKKDQTISFENALRIQKGLKDNPKAEFFFPEEGVHGGLSANIQVEYEERVIKFFKRSL